MAEFPLLGFFMPGPPEMIIILVIAVLLFGKRLPEVGRSLGKSIIEFKKGVRGIEEEIETATTESSTETSHHEEDDREEATAPKFEPPASEHKTETVEE